MNHTITNAAGITLLEPLDNNFKTGGGCELSRNLRISVTRNENVPRHFLLWHVFCRHFGGAWRRVKTDTIHTFFEEVGGDSTGTKSIRWVS